MDKEQLEIIQEAESNLPLTAGKIHEEVTVLGKEIWSLIDERSVKIFGNARRSSWLFRGRVLQALFSNHFGYVIHDSMEILKREERKKNEENI